MVILQQGDDIGKSISPS